MLKDVIWKKRTTNYIEPADDVIIDLSKSEVISFGSDINGVFGIRTNGGVMEKRDSDGLWIPIADGGGGALVETFETVSANLKSYDYSINYNLSGDVSNIVYSNGITKTLQYTDGDISSIILSGATPNNIALTKTLTYSNGDVVGITYT